MVQSGETFRTPGCEQILWEDVEDAGGCLSRTRIKTRTRIRIRRSTRIKTRTRIRIRSSTRIRTRTRIRIRIRMARHLSGAVCLHETGSSWGLSSTTIVRSSWTLSCCSYVDIAAAHPGHPRH